MLRQSTEQDLVKSAFNAIFARSRRWTARKTMVCALMLRINRSWKYITKTQLGDQENIVVRIFFQQNLSNTVETFQDQSLDQTRSMDRRLYKAAVKGDVPLLLQLLQEDELVLERALIGPHLETPLHIAAMLRHSEFVQEILRLKPELASELDSQRSTPLHLAAARGYVRIVKSLLSAYPEACLVADKYGRNPAQVAAIKGKVEVLEDLVGFNPEAARSINRNGETVLHMCVKNSRLESLRVIVGMFGREDEFIDWRDKGGNSALHLAAADGQFEVTTSKTSIFQSLLSRKKIILSISKSHCFFLNFYG